MPCLVQGKGDRTVRISGKNAHGHALMGWSDGTLLRALQKKRPTVAQAAIALLGDVIHVDVWVGCQDGLELGGLRKKIMSGCRGRVQV